MFKPLNRYRSYQNPKLFQAPDIAFEVVFIALVVAFAAEEVALEIELDKASNGSFSAFLAPKMMLTTIATITPIKMRR
jgi:hypothetical protein